MTVLPRRMSNSRTFSSRPRAFAHGLARGAARVIPLAIALLFVLATAAIGIAACKPAPVPIHDVVECAKLEAPKLKDEAAALLAIALSSGWAAAETRAESDVLTLGGDIVGCAFAMLVDQYLTERTASSPEQSWQAHDAMEKLRAKLSPPGNHVTFRTDKGNL